ncbi:MAG TPA: STAS domain-containing protein [Oryzihumus sp.]|nr:STAS domain-containing protein [Oryzihumus sp.]
MTEDGADPATQDTALARLVPPGWRQALDSSPAAIGITLGSDHRLAYQNLASQATFGARQLGLPLREVFPEASEEWVAPLNRVLLTGETIDVPARRVGVHDQLGDEVLMRYVLAPLGEPAEGVVISAVDVTAEVRAEQALARSDLLAGVGARLTGAPSAQAALQGLTDALVPAVADVAAVYVVDGPDTDPTNPLGHPLPPAVATVTPGLAGLGPLPDPPPRLGPAPWDTLIRSGRSVVIPLGEGLLPGLAPDSTVTEWLRDADASSMAVIPLVVTGTLFGAVIMLSCLGRVPYLEADLPFFEEVVARAGAAISQVRTMRQQRDLAAQVREVMHGLERVLHRLEDASPTFQHDADGVLRCARTGGGIRLEGEVDAGNAHVVAAALRAVTDLDPAPVEVEVDLSRLTLIDVCGARSLLTATQAYRARAGVVLLRSPDQAVRRLLELVGVYSEPGVEGGAG